MGLNRVGVSRRLFEDETEPVSEELCFLVLRIPNDEQSPGTQWFWVICTILSIIQNLREELYDETWGFWC
jgi:hypothetical protein